MNVSPGAANPFRDRAEAGRLLAVQLARYAHRDDVVVLALPRGGVPVAFEVAKKLAAPLDIFLVRKLGLPGHEEFAIGAIASGGIRVVNPEAVRHLGISEETLDEVAEQEGKELARRERLYRGDRPPISMEGKIAILIDDGLATGSSMRAAVAAAKQHQPKRLIVAVPVAPPETCQQLSGEVDEAVCLLQPDPFYAVGLWYEHFGQTSDQEVCDLLERAALSHPHTAHH